MSLSGSTQDLAVPHLIYAGDVAVQSYLHGSSLLYRLLSDWPEEKLLIVETSWIASEKSRRIPGVRYVHHRPWWTRAFLSPRLARLAPLFATMAERAWRGLAEVAEGFPANALLTVAHGFNWLGVSAWAQTRNLPLHLIIHDDWARPRGAATGTVGKLDATFARHYRAAASRLCVSPFMEEFYRARYGAAGRVFYPSRDPAIHAPGLPLPRVSRPVDNLCAAFAGTLHPGYEKPLGVMARALEGINGRLLMFGPFGPDDLFRAGLTGPGVEYRGLLGAQELQDALRHEADVLCVPMSFEENDRANTEASFPSKLADYSACGLPILIQAPSWSSAARWARENPEAALLVESADDAALPAALNDLKNDAALRVRLAAGAIAVGARFFSAEAAARYFRECLLSA